MMVKPTKNPEMKPSAVPIDTVTIILGLSTSNNGTNDPVPSFSETCSTQDTCTTSPQVTENPNKNDKKKTRKRGEIQDSATENVISCPKYVQIGSKSFNYWKCRICDKMFGFKSQVKSHMSVHTGNRFYLCETCGKTFRLQSCLRRHQLTHSAVKNHVCNICKRQFSRASGIKTHKVCIPQP